MMTSQRTAFRILFTTVFFWQVRADVTCPFSTCTCTQFKIDCAVKDLTNLPNPPKGITFTQTIFDMSVNYIHSFNGHKLPASLENIDASSNTLTNIPDFSFMPNLTVVDMSFNSLKSFNFHHLPTSVVELDLSWNNMVSLPNLATLVHLEKLVLLHNHIHIVHSLPRSLVYLQLQQNNITRFFDTSSLTKLEYLKLNENHIVDSNSKLFPRSLVNLYLTNNLLTHVPADVTNLANLKEFSISSNQIKSIDSFVFPSSITKLWVTNTSIESLATVVFHNDVSHIEFASFFLNPLKTIASNAFTHMHNLTRVELDLCKLTRLPAALKSCPGLTTANLLNNPDMICTCAEASVLLPLYSKSSPVDMYGYCNGNIAVNRFMTTLAKDCPTSPH